MALAARNADAIDLTRIRPNYCAFKGVNFSLITESADLARQSLALPELVSRDLEVMVVGVAKVN